MNFKPPLNRQTKNTIQTVQPRLIVSSQGIRRVSSQQSNRPKSSSLNRALSVSKADLRLKLGVPVISAQSYCIGYGDGKTIIGYQQYKKMPIASITKLMTGYVTLQLIKQFKINLESYFYVSYEAAEIAGTSAFLQGNDQIKLIDLLHGLLLPSGNDAALVIAENLATLFKERTANIGIQYRIQPFVQQMNNYAQQLQMHDTQFYNPHGLSADQSFSTSDDLFKLCIKILDEPILLDVVKKSEYTCYIKRKNQQWKQTWHNTNKLLHLDGYCGLKTGQTFKAGPCLATLYKDGIHTLIVILLNCLNSEIRWEETVKLVDWAKDRGKVQQ